MLLVKHSFVSSQPDETNATVVRPSAWNADHVVTGDLPVANLNGGAGASSSTFWRGDGSWASPPFVVSAGAGAVFDYNGLVSAASISPSINSIITNGYYAAGDGGGGTYKRVTTAPSHSGKLQSADGAWWALVLNDGKEVNVFQFGAKGDDVTDDLPAFNAALAYLKAIGGNPTPKLFIPVPYRGGTFYLSGPMNVHMTGYIYGVGGGKGNRNPGSLLRFGKDQWGIVLHDSTTTDDGGGIAFGDAGAGGGSAGSCVEGLSLWGGAVKAISGPYGGWPTLSASGNGTTATLTFSALPHALAVGGSVYVSGVAPAGYNGTYTVTASTATSVSYANSTTGSQTSSGYIADNLNGNAHGIWIRSAYCTIRDCNVSFFRGNGIHCMSFSGSTGSTSGQANCGRIENCTTIYNAGAGIHIQGSDANAWVIADCTISDCGSGVDEFSFLGNTHIGHQTQNNGYVDPLRGGAPTGCCDFGGNKYIVYGTDQAVNASTAQPGPVATTGASGTGSTATLAFAAMAAPYPVNSYITVSGVSPAGYNGVYQVTASTLTSVSYSCAATGPQTAAGTAASNVWAQWGGIPSTIHWVPGLTWRCTAPFLTLTTNTTANNVFLGCYQEGSQPPNQSTSRTMFLGGSFGYTLGGVAVDASQGLTSYNPISVVGSSSATRLTYGEFGSSGSPTMVYELLYNNVTNSLTWGMDATGTLLQMHGTDIVDPMSEAGLAGDYSPYGPGHYYIGALFVGTGSQGLVIANFTGVISGTALAVSNVSSGAGGIQIGQTVTDFSGHVAPGTYITGGSGTTWTVNISQTVASEPMQSGHNWIQLGSLPHMVTGVQTSLPVNQSQITTVGSRYYYPTVTPGWPEGLICTSPGHISGVLSPAATFKPFGRVLGSIPFASLPAYADGPVASQISCVNNCSTTTPGALADGAGSSEVMVAYVRGAWRVML